MMNIDLQLKTIASNIKLIAFDVDGVMTDGSLTFFEDGKEFKTFNAKDGLGVSMLSKSGVITAIITARKSPIVDLRARMIDIKEVYQNEKNKVKAIEDLRQKYDLNYSQIAYVGDDLIDIEVLKLTGLKACPKDAVCEVIDICNFVSSKEGGRGAVREVCDLILKSKNIKFSDIVNQ